MTAERLEQRRAMWKRLNDLRRMRAQLQADYFDEAIRELEMALRQKEGEQLGNTVNPRHRQYRLTPIPGCAGSVILRGRIPHKQLA